VFFGCGRGGRFGHAEHFRGVSGMVDTFCSLSCLLEIPQQKAKTTCTGKIKATSNRPSGS
jgi:hypothetical protein